VRTVPIVLGETSSYWGGGKANVSNRFASGFWFLGQSGFLAGRGYLAMVRQDFAGGDYGLVDMEGNGFSPNPDYFTTALYQRLVGSDVIRVDARGESARAYAYCKRGGARGDAVVTFLNTSPEARALRLGVNGTEGAPAAEVYELTSCGMGLQSKLACLNGKELRVDGRTWALPAMVPRTVAPGASVSVSGHSYGFVVVPGAVPSICNAGGAASGA